MSRILKCKCDSYSLPTKKSKSIILPAIILTIFKTGLLTEGESAAGAETKIAANALNLGLRLMSGIGGGNLPAETTRDETDLEAPGGETTITEIAVTKTMKKS